jgi:hypothetical protein
MTDPGFRFERDERRGRVVITLSAEVTVDVWWASVWALVAEQVWRDPVVYDMSAADSMPLLLNLPDVAHLVQTLTAAHGRRDAVAIVVRHEDIEPWRQRLSPLFRNVVVIDVFPTLVAAHDWLDSLVA